MGKADYITLHRQRPRPLGVPYPGATALERQGPVEYPAKGWELLSLEKFPWPVE